MFHVAYSYQDHSLRFGIFVDVSDQGLELEVYLYTYVASFNQRRRSRS